jgi:hypothetical protein
VQADVGNDLEQGTHKSQPDDLPLRSGAIGAGGAFDTSVFDVRTCRVCGCTDDDCSGCMERTGEPCHWVSDDLCSACAEKKPERFALDPESGFVRDTANHKWLTTAEEVFDALLPLMSNAGRQVGKGNDDDTRMDMRLLRK